MKKIFILQFLLLLQGCLSSVYVTPHQAYVPMLKKTGSLDIAAAFGPSTYDFAAAAHVAYAPVEPLEIFASVDLDPVIGGDSTGNGRGTAHVGGDVGLGVFLPHDVIRLELQAGVGGGWGQGTLTDSRGSGPTFAATSSGGHFHVFGQLTAGFELKHFALAAGVRGRGTFAKPSISPTPLNAYEHNGVLGTIKPLINLRIPIENFRIDFITGWMVPTSQNQVLYFNSGIEWYLTFGFGFQFDTNPSAEHMSI